jgi:hypothetical protein
MPKAIAAGWPIDLKSFVLRVATDAPVRTAMVAIKPSVRVARLTQHAHKYESKLGGWC